MARSLAEHLDPNTGPKRVDQFANGHPDNMKLLLEIGRKAAPAYVSDKWPDPKFDLPEWAARA